MRAASRLGVSMLLAVLISGPGNAQTRSSAGRRDFLQEGLVALQANKLEDALQALTAAEQTSPNDAKIRNFRGVALMALGRSDEAAKEYERSIQLDDHLEDAYRNLGFLEWNARNEDRALKHLLHALALAPEDEFAAYYLTRVEEDQHFVNSTAVLSRLAEKNRPWATFDLALTQLKNGRFEDAARRAQALVSRQLPVEEKAATYSLLGICEAKLHHDEQALAALQQATHLSPDREEYWLNLTRHQMEADRLSDAISAAQESLHTLPKSYALHLRLGAAYFSAGKYAEAETVFRELVSAGDPLPLSYIGLAQVLLRTGRAEEATRVLKDAEHSVGPHFLVFYFQGLAFSRAGDRTAALEAFRRALKLSPQSAEAHLGVGKTCLALGKTGEAVSELQAAVRLDPGNLPAKRLLGQAYTRLGDQSSAAKLNSTAGETPDQETVSHLVGDFLLPDWMQPR